MQASLRAPFCDLLFLSTLLATLYIKKARPAGGGSLAAAISRRIHGEGNFGRRPRLRGVLIFVPEHSSTGGRRKPNARDRRRVPTGQPPERPWANPAAP